MFRLGRKPQARRARRTTRQRSAIGLLLGTGLIGALLALAPVVVPTAEAYSNAAATFSGQGCNGDNSVGTWGSVTVPANAVSFTFTITGAGGSGGDNNAGQGGRGGRGAIVTATVPVTAGQVLWTKIGCGGREGGTADGYTTGPGISNLAGGGGGSSVMCIGSGTGSCGGGTVVAIAAGGGGGGRGSGTGACSDKTGGAGGDAGNSGAGTSGGGTAYNGFGGGNGDGTPQAFGGGAGTTAGGGGGGGQGAGSAGGGPNTNLPNGSGNGGSGNSGKNDIQAGGGGAGYAGGGGGGGGEDGNCSFGNWASAGGGGGGSSWVRSTGSGIGVSTASFLGGCTAGAINSNAGGAASQGNQSWGCGGGLSGTSFSIGNQPTGANQSGLNATKGTGLGIALGNADLDGNNRTCQIVTSPAKGGVVLSGGAPGTNCTATYTANANTIGADSFTYRVVDTDNLFSAVNYTIGLTVLNRVPTGTAVASPGTTINKGAASNFVLGTADLDGDSPFTCTITTAPTKATIAAGTTCTKALTPNANTIGVDSFAYTVTDSVGGVSTPVTVNYTIANRVPTGANQTLSVDAGTALPIALANTDLDLVDTLTCVTAGGPTKGALTGTGCNRTYTSNAGTANNGIGGADSFTYTPQDQNGGVGATQTIGLTIRNPDLSLTKTHSGRFQPGTGTGTYTLSFANTATSAANGTTTITDTLPAGMKYRSSAVGASGFTCVGTAGVSTTVTCTRATAIPASGTGSLTISVDVAENAATPVNNSAVISSLYELTGTATNNTAVDATVINIRPVANPVTVATGVDTPVIVGLSATDANGDALTYGIVATPLNGTLSGTGASRQYTPDSGYQGIDTFTYRVTDPDGLQSNTATVTLYVGVSKFTGSVTNEVGGAALSGITVYLVDNSVPSNPDPALVATATTNGAGAYDFAPQFPALGGVPHGNYVIRFYDATNNFISEWNANAASRATATNVAVSSASPTIAINAALTPGARIQGTLRSTAGGNPTINGLQVRLYKIGTAGSKAVTSSGAGQYKFELLTAGQYQLWFRDVSSGQWHSEWYDEATSQATSTTVNLAVGQQLLIDESLVPVVAPPEPTVGTVTGTVRSAGVGNAPLAGIQVRLYTGPTYETSQATTTDGNGQYSFANVTAGSYKLWFRALSGSSYTSEYYNDKADLASADVLTVGAGSTIADALLTPAAPPAPANTGMVSGTVTETDGVTPIVGLQVRLYLEGQTAGSVAATTDADGHYTFTGRAPGTYQVWFRDLTNTWFSEWYDDQANQAAATPVSVSNGATTTVNASLTAK